MNFTGFRPEVLEFLYGPSENNPKVCIGQFQRFAPIQQWLVDLLAD